jgi:Mrp family chromosome partitioning ATPase
LEKIQQALERARHEREMALASSATGRARRGRGGPGLEERFFVPELDTIPTVEASAPALRRHRIVAAQAGNLNHTAAKAAEAFRMLRAQVVSRLDALGGRSVAVTSPYGGDGKSIVALNLAATLAGHLERGAVLIDTDLRRPSLHTYLGIEPLHDLSQHLAGEVALDDCLLRPGIEGLVVLLQSRAIRRSSELLASSRMQAFMSEVKRRFPTSILVFDCPPLLATEDPLVIRQHVDGCLLVLREGVTSKADLRRAAELVGEERYLGAVLNHAKWHQLPGYYY